MTEPKITREQIEQMRGDAEFIGNNIVVAICTLALQALDMEPRPETHAEWQQKRGLLAVKVDWAISEYNQYLMERHHNAWRVLERIIEGLRYARAMSLREPRT